MINVDGQIYPTTPAPLSFTKSYSLSLSNFPQSPKWNQIPPSVNLSHQWRSFSFSCYLPLQFQVRLYFFFKPHKLNVDDSDHNYQRILSDHPRDEDNTTTSSAVDLHHRREVIVKIDAVDNSDAFD